MTEPGAEPPASPPTSSEPAARRSHLVDLTPLRSSPAFARLWIGEAVAGIGGQMTVVAVMLQIYDFTGSTTAVSGVALFALVPMVVFGLYGGMLADAFDRRAVALVSAIVAWGSTATIALLAWTGLESVWLLYVLTMLNTVASTVITTTRSAIYPRLLPRELLPAAAAMHGIAMGAMVTVGPALAGVLVATVGFGPTYTVDVVLFVTAFLGIATLPRILPEGEVQRPGLESLRYGLAFLRRAPNIRAGFLVDIIAMTFGQPRVLFPAVGAVVLGGGAVTAGVLTASTAVGAMVCGLLSGRLGAVRWQGRAIARAVQVYGLCIAGFAVVLLVATLLGGNADEDFGGASIAAIAVAALFLAGSGAADNVSAVFRSTMLQTAVPDNMRGRLQGVFTVVVTGGPRLGDLYVGALALVAAAWFPPLLGGIVIVVLAGVVLRVTRSFREYDGLDPKP
ncbi:MFS transporter [Cnuibacter physcomitrellae]|uniref:MFS transporter n=1 Tax=Cnuibacter physcomitrellae TaxID=1619308 RepID=A0A1X9LK52_9MICO|nr:MFS transporter [Cnuibacter physcomitrellae]ARJ05553.1 MFS transporter [Cnuibacter physcomitrellae]